MWQRGRREDGQALVEFALVIPILLLVLLAILDFGRAVNDWNDMNSLANLAARYAAVGAPISDTTSGCKSLDAQLVPYILCKAGVYSKPLQPPNGNNTGPGLVKGVSVCVYAGTDQPGAPVNVRVSAAYNPLPLPKALGGSTTFGQIQLSGTATMRVEQPASAGGLDITTGSTGTCSTL